MDGNLVGHRLARRLERIAVDDGGGSAHDRSVNSPAAGPKRTAALGRSDMEWKLKSGDYPYTQGTAFTGTGNLELLSVGKNRLTLGVQPSDRRPN